MTIVNLSRRRFIVGAGVASGGLIVGITMGTDNSVYASTQAGDFNPNAFIHLNANGETVIYCGRCEMGQGISTALPAAVADEMDADWAMVKVKQADGNEEKYGPQETGGSQSIRTMYIPMRKAGAAAKAMLIAAAAQVWEVSANNCYAKSHAIFNKLNQQKLSYGELATLAATMDVPDEPKLKDKEDYQYIGKSIPRHDQLDAITGKIIYGTDAKIQGLKYAAIRHCPVLGGQLKSLDKSAALKMKGVVDVVEIPRLELPYGSIGGVAVVADDSWTAEQALNKLVIEWDPGANQVYNTKTYKQQLVKNVEKPAEVVLERGNLSVAFSDAKKKMSATYTAGHLAHAPMEPNASLVWVRDDSCEVWASTQSPADIQKVLGKYLGRDAKEITVHVMISGGAFGRKFKCDYVQEAAALSKHVKAPVQLTWSREEDMRTGFYHSISAQHIEASLDDKGNITGWLHRAAFPSIATLFNPSLDRAPADSLSQINNHPFGIANFRSETGEAKAHTRIGWYRAVYSIFYGFACSTFADELAHKAGIDPLKFLHQTYDNNKNPDFQEPVRRSKGVLDLVAQKAGWNKRQLPAGQGMGIAVYYSFSSYVAMAVHVDVSDGNIKVLNVDCALDCGQILNPDGAAAQMEGAVAMGMSFALSTEVNFEEGAVTNSNFDDYPVLRITGMPNVRTHYVKSDAKPTGLGEPGIAPFAPALSNAIFAASGKRYRDMPFKPEDS